MITQTELKKFIHYCPETGLLTWVARSGPAKINGIAGTVNGDGYIQIGLKRASYKAHRLAFLYMTGSFPKDQMDHVNHDRSDNRWSNLREVSNQDNNKNCRLQSNNTSGVVGVYWEKREKKWRARIKIDGKTRHLGYFNEINNAIAARAEANIKYGFHANHGNPK